MDEFCQKWVNEFWINVKYLNYDYNYLNRNPSGQDIQTEIPEADSNGSNLFHIENDGLTVGKNPNQKRYEFWNTLREKYKSIFAKEDLLGNDNNIRNIIHGFTPRDAQTNYVKSEL